MRRRRRSCSACCAAAGGSCSSLPWRRWWPPSECSTRSPGAAGCSTRQHRLQSGRGRPARGRESALAVPVVPGARRGRTESAAHRGRPRHPVDGRPRRAPAGALVSEGGSGTLLREIRARGSDRRRVRGGLGGRDPQRAAVPVHVYRGRRASSASSAIRTRSSPIRRPARTRRSRARSATSCRRTLLLPLPATRWSGSSAASVFCAGRPPSRPFASGRTTRRPSPASSGS